MTSHSFFVNISKLKCVNSYDNSVGNDVRSSLGYMLQPNVPSTDFV
jgi:hypothetical protein